MFRQISWNTYLEFIAFVLAIYYIVVFIVHYKNQITNLELINSFEKDTTTVNSKMEPGTEHIESLLEEIQGCIHQANRNRCPKEEILFAIHGLINDEALQAFDKQSCKNVINDLVAKTFENVYSIHLNEEDLTVLWT
jgi:hypothetical protein